MISLLIAKLLLTILMMCLCIVMIKDLKLCTIVTNQEDRVSFDEDHMRLDARKPAIRVCDVVILSHEHKSTGENVRGSQRIQRGS